MCIEKVNTLKDTHFNQLEQENKNVTHSIVSPVIIRVSPKQSIIPARLVLRKSKSVPVVKNRKNGNK